MILPERPTVYSTPQLLLIFTARGYESLFSQHWNSGLCGVAWGWDHSLPSCPSQFLSAVYECGTAHSAGHPCLTATAWLLPCCMHHTTSSPPLLPIWMNVSSLNPWLLDFHTVRYSGSSGCILFLGWLLSFLWLCKEAKQVYLHLPLGWKLKPFSLRSGISRGCSPTNFYYA